MTTSMKNACKKKYLYIKFLQNITEHNEKRYKMNKNKLTAILKYCKKNFSINLLNKYKNDIKQTVKILKAISKGKKYEHSYLSDFVVSNENTINHKNATANKYNHFFVSIGQELASKIQHINNAQLGNKVSTDCNNIGVVLNKNCIESIIRPFNCIWNKSFESGIFSDNMKISKLIPVFNAGEKSKLNNDRPIVILPQFSEILEKFLEKRLDSFLKKHNIINKSQHGFNNNNNNNNNNGYF